MLAFGSFIYLLFPLVDLIQLKIATLVILSGLFLFDRLSAEDGPWRLNDALENSDRISVFGHQRSRYESLEGQFRTGRQQDEAILAFRTAVQLDLDFESFGITGELMDSRQELADSETPLSTSIVNAVELIQGFASWEFDNLGEAGSQARLKIGRQTMDLNSRRLVARNRFRNTVNNFTGANFLWSSSSGEQLHLFYVLPVHRLPTDSSNLLHNKVRIDEEYSEVRFWGIRLVSPDWFKQVSGEFYLYGLNEDDHPDLATRNRQLLTGGIRLLKNPSVGQIDFELESTIQVGESRASRSESDTRDLNHQAHHHHFHLGYSFNHEWSPRLLFQFDYASGDENPNDNDNNRFDTLYGARRFEYGPTGAYGAFARSNIISPAYRLILSPRKDINILFAHRFHWLASDTDAWTTGGLRDVSGNSGSYLGHQPEIRIRWDVRPGNLRIEPGIAHLFAGEFLRNAPNSNGQSDSTYVYLQSIFTF